MNQKTTYEITIAEKLGHLNVPDMREAIWSRIEEQLDMDPPGNDDPGPDSPKNPDWVSITRRFGTFAVVVALVTTIFFINKKQPAPGNRKQQSPEPKEQVITPIDKNESPPGKTINPVNTPVIPAGTNTHTPVGDSAVNTDQALNADRSPVLIDTPVSRKIMVPPPQHASTPVIKPDTVPKKSKGFKGITDNDYRISMKKDSVP